MKHFNNKSENAAGEVLLHEIAIAKGKRNPRWPDEAAAITEWLVEKAGLETDSFNLVDGSGLSRYNLISADSSVHLLEYMHHHPPAATFYSSLPTYELEIGARNFPSWRQSPAAWPVARQSPAISPPPTDDYYLANGYIGSAEPVFELRQEVWQVLVQDHGD